MEKNKIEKIYDQIHAPENLKQETYEKMKNNTRKNKDYKFILRIAALFIFTIAIGSIYYINKPDLENVKQTEVAVDVLYSDLNHFENIEDLREYFEKNLSYHDYGLMFNSEQMAEVEDTETVKTAVSTSSDSNYYQTNTQVKNVDEADISKTDGTYIYYVANNTVYIVNASDLTLESKLDFSGLEENSNYFPRELFIKDDKLIVIGNYTEYTEKETSEDTSKSMLYDTSYVESYLNTTKAYIYNIKDKSEPKELRQIDIDGYYDTSRLIGDTLYLISTKNIYYRTDMKDSELIPIYYDTAYYDEYQNIDCKKIIYNEDSKENVYKMVGAINIENNDEVKIETFLGYGSTVYCSENNLYLASSVYNSENTDALEQTQIYKFNISEGNLKYFGQTIIDGKLNNQFSLDEYEGNLRIATTVTIEQEPSKTSNEGNYTVVTIGKTTTNNILYVLDENLQKIGELTDFGIEEQIYSVRFVGNVAYIVTFQQIDPLFVIDLSDPSNPTLKGELEIPGYSSYLHVYDENHIIGIGYNVKDNGHGGVTNETVKVSMFDVSDLNNPKEIFSKTLGENFSYSNVTYNHKLLMYDEQRNLMGFPITMRNEDNNVKDSVVILQIDLENQEFKIHSKYEVSFNYNLRKVIYIEDNIYILSDKKILGFDMNTSENVGTLELD